MCISRKDIALIGKIQKRLATIDTQVQQVQFQILNYIVDLGKYIIVMLFLFKNFKGSK